MLIHGDEKWFGSAPGVPRIASAPTNRQRLEPCTSNLRLSPDGDELFQPMGMMQWCSRDQVEAEFENPFELNRTPSPARYMARNFQETVLSRNRSCAHPPRP